MPEESPYMLEDHSYMPEEHKYMPEERGYMTRGFKCQKSCLCNICEVFHICFSAEFVLCMFAGLKVCIYFQCMSLYVLLLMTGDLEFG